MAEGISYGVKHVKIEGKSWYVVSEGEHGLQEYTQPEMASRYYNRLIKANQ